MRLSTHQQQQIRDTVREVFGPSAAVRVFGSRADDTRRGGDLDLLVETDLADADAALEAKLRLLVKLKQRLGDQRIDLVLTRPGRDAPLPIVTIARTTGIPL